MMVPSVQHITVIGALLLVIIKPTDAAIQSTYEKCTWSIGGPENRNCPFYDLAVWNCLAKMKCGNVTKYHCAKDLYGKWTEACDDFELCQEGEEPHIVTGRVFCGNCLDPETYNTDDNKPSNTFSQCPQRKTKCDTNGRVECDEPYRSNDPDSKYKMDRRCRCAYEKGYIPRFYDEKKDIWRCITASELTCDVWKCDPVDGVAHSRGEDYRCHPDKPATVNPTKTTDENVIFSETKSKKSIFTQTTAKPRGTTTSSSTSSTTETKEPENEGQNTVIVIGAVIGGLILVGLIIAVSVVVYKKSIKVSGAQISYSSEKISRSMLLAHKEGNGSIRDEPTTLPGVEGIFKRVLNKNIGELKLHLSPCTLDSIIEAEIGYEGQHRDIRDIKSTRDRNEKIVDLIRAGGFIAYKHFKVILWKTKQKYLLKRLGETEEDLLREDNDGDVAESLL